MGLEKQAHSPLASAGPWLPGPWEGGLFPCRGPVTTQTASRVSNCECLSQALYLLVCGSLSHHSRPQALERLPLPLTFKLSHCASLEGPPRGHG